MTSRSVGRRCAARPPRAAAVALLGALVLGCEAEPDEVLLRALRATAAGEASALPPLLHPDYADTLGDGRDLVRDLSAWFEVHPPASFDHGPIDRSDVGASARRLRLRTTVAAAWDGEPQVQLTGPLDVTLERWAGYRIRAGFLTDLRDLDRFVRAWEAARRQPDPDTLRPLLDPNYDDDFVTRAQIAQRWMSAGPEAARVTLVRMEVRDDLAHLDLHELVGPTPGGRPRIHRLTLRPVAGRWRVTSGLSFPATNRP